MTFGERLKQFREARGLTQEQLAIAIGVAKTTVTGYERGNREPDVAKIKKLAAALGVSGDELLGTGQEKKPTLVLFIIPSPPLYCKNKNGSVFWQSYKKDFCPSIYLVLYRILSNCDGMSTCRRLFYFTKIKSLSIDTPRASESRSAASNVGTCAPLSASLTALRLTPLLRASCSWLQPRASRYSLIRFSTIKKHLHQFVLVGCPQKVFLC